MLKKLNIFNFLRGIAALLVIMFHIVWITNKIHPEVPMNAFFTMPCWTGVWIFFIISGYLIGKGFVSLRYKTNKVRDFIRFYIQRTIRILPLYFFIIIIDLFFVNTQAYFNLENEILFRSFTLTLKQGHLTSMTGNLWFICTLSQLYLIAPFVDLLVLKPLRKLKYCKIYTTMLMLALIIFEYIMRSVNLGHHEWSGYIYGNVIFNLDVFFCGFLFNIFMEKNTFNKIKEIMMPVSLLLFFSFLLINIQHMQKHWMLDIGAEDIKIYAVIATIFTTLLLIYSFDYKKTDNINKLAWWNPFRWVEYLGIISMGFFIAHCQTIFNLNKSININKDFIYTNNFFGFLTYPLKISITSEAAILYIIAVLTICFSIIWGMIIHFMLEKPLNKFRYSLIDRSK